MAIDAAMLIVKTLGAKLDADLDPREREAYHQALKILRGLMNGIKFVPPLEPERLAARS